MRLILRPLYKLYETLLFRHVRNAPMPQHIAIIMDGNRRYARMLGLPRTYYGHHIATEKLRQILRWVWELDIKYLTLYAFSTENFRRPPDEVEALMRLAEKKFLELATDNDIHKNRVKIKAIGRLNLLPKHVREAINRAQEATAEYGDRVLQIAIGYGGRAEMVDAFRQIASLVKTGRIDISDINEDLINQYLYTSETPDPDLIIRTSGEERLSGFLLWQSAYSELYFADIYFPAFRKIDFLRAIRSYQQRQRRFGR